MSGGLERERVVVWIMTLSHTAATADARTAANANAETRTCARAASSCPPISSAAALSSSACRRSAAISASVSSASDAARRALPWVTKTFGGLGGRGCCREVLRGVCGERSRRRNTRIGRPRARASSRHQRPTLVSRSLRSLSAAET